MFWPTISLKIQLQKNSEKFKRHKIKAEHTALNFNTNNMEDYNAPFKMGELVDSLKKSHDTAVGPDDIHCQILKHLPECTLDTLLNIYNQNWDGGDFPTEWREATIIHIPKPGKDTLKLLKEWLTAD